MVVKIVGIMRWEARVDSLCQCTLWTTTKERKWLQGRTENLWASEATPSLDKIWMKWMRYKPWINTKARAGSKQLIAKDCLQECRQWDRKAYSRIRSKNKLSNRTKFFKTRCPTTSQVNPSNRTQRELNLRVRTWVNTKIDKLLPSKGRLLNLRPPSPKAT